MPALPQQGIECLPRASPLTRSLPWPPPEYNRKCTHTPTTTPTPTPAPKPKFSNPKSAHLPASVDPSPVPKRAATRKLQTLHRTHNLAEHTVRHHPKRQALALTADAEDPAPIRRLHASPAPAHPARSGPRAVPRATTITDTIAPVTYEELTEILTETQSKSNKHVPTRGLMYPGPFAQQHPAGPMLQKFGTEGCPVDIVDKWTIQQLDQAVAYGAHPSAENPIAAKALRAETLEKVNQQFARLVPWSELRRAMLAGHKTHTKISPIAAIPHKSRLYRMILDLSNKGQRRKRQITTTSVNDLTNEDAAPMTSMHELGRTLGRVIYAVGTRPTNQGPLLFCKLDIKDGFWRMCVPSADEEQFCYVLPPDPDNPDAEVMIVVPAALQMGWKSSPPLFCAATETGRDIAEWLRQHVKLPPHPLEHHMLDHINPALLAKSLPTLDSPQARLDFYHLFEVYVDDYIGLLHTKDPDVIRHHSRALLHAIHQIFPPPAATGHAGEEPISLKKLVIDGEGIWDTRKEILGWIFDGLDRTMQLPAKKVASLRETIKTTMRSGHIDTKEFESFIGKCQHACLGIPGGTALLPPLYKALHSAKRSYNIQVQIHKHSTQYHALRDLQTMFKVLGKEPIQCSQLVPGTPDYIGYCDACNYGAGGIWLSGSKTLRPLVWRIKWPPDIVQRIKDKHLTINDLEMAGLVFQYLLLEKLVDMPNTQSAVWCDNTSAVSWTVKMNSQKSVIGQQLTRILSLRMLVNKSSHLAALSIAGVDNDLADLASRSFKKTGVHGNYDLTDEEFLTKFNSDFPLQQGASWLFLRHRDKISSLVFTLLRGETLPTGSWIKLSACDSDIGLTGSTSAPNIMKWIPFSKTLRHQHKLQSWELSPVTSVKGGQAEDIKSALAQFRMRYAPSARAANWLLNPTRSTTPKPTGDTGTTSKTS